MRNPLVWAAVALIFASTISRIASQTRRVPPVPLPAQAAAPRFAEFTNYLVVDPVNFLMIPPSGDPNEIRSWNTPEQVRLRRDATWAGQNPQEFWRQHPKKKDELDAARAAVQALTRPGTRTPQEQASDAAAYDSILQPVSQ